ncbi:hypothetical protein V2J09_013900 [Rumex salicifolius]
METKCDRRTMLGIQRRCGFKNGFTVDCIGKSNGLCLMWDESVTVNVQSYTFHHTVADVRLRDSDPLWRFTGVYKWSRTDEKQLTFGLLKQLATLSSNPWILHLEDKYGGQDPDFGRIIDFRETLEECKFSEISYVGNRFTWDNGREDDEFIQERLDIGLSTDSWKDLFPDAKIHHLERRGSDHVPIRLNLDNFSIVNQNPKGPKPFRFEAMWLDDDNCSEIVRNAWLNPNSHNAEQTIVGKLSWCSEDLRD